MPEHVLVSVETCLAAVAQKYVISAFKLLHLFGFMSQFSEVILNRAMLLVVDTSTVDLRVVGGD
jgi:hypothetical protein